MYIFTLNYRATRGLPYITTAASPTLSKIDNCWKKEVILMNSFYTRSMIKVLMKAHLLSTSINFH